MRIINKVNIPQCRQWVKELTKQAIQIAKLDCNKIVIEEFDGDRICFRDIENEYIIRVWDFYPLDFDKQVRACRAFITYTLYIMVEKIGGNNCENIQGAIPRTSHGEMIERGALGIVWKN